MKLHRLQKTRPREQAFRGENVSLARGVDVGFLPLGHMARISDHGPPEGPHGPDPALLHRSPTERIGIGASMPICRPRKPSAHPQLVRQIMRVEALIACWPRPFRITTEADAEAAAGMPGLVRHDFTADRPGVKFVGGITYIHNWQGFLFSRDRHRLLLEEGRGLDDRGPRAHRTRRERASKCGRDDADHG